MLTVGYIGLGIMGKAMARNILKAGFPVVVHNRSRDSVNELVSEGAEEAFSPAEVASRSNVARKLAAKLSEKRVQALDAPVSGGDIGARDATLTIMVGGEESALQKVMPILNAVGKTITHVGESGAGQVAKAANQIMVAAQMVAMGELLVLAKKTGVDPAKVVEAIKGGAAQCWTLDVKPQRLFAGNRRPGFKAYMQAKDLDIVLDTAREYGIALPATAENAQLYHAMLQMGMGDLDNSAVIGVIETLAGKKLIEN